MSLLFHQNMRRFGGGNVVRNFAYAGTFNAIQGTVGAAEIEVAGFTEVTNNGAAAGAFGPDGLCDALGVVHLANIACGETALANGKSEYIAIGHSPDAQVQSVGRILLNTTGMGGGLRLIHDVAPAVPPPADWCDGSPSIKTPLSTTEAWFMWW